MANTNRKVVFSVTARSGSRLTGQLLTGIPRYNYVGIVGDKEYQELMRRQNAHHPANGPIFVATQPEFTCPLYGLHKYGSREKGITQFDSHYLNDNSKYETEAFIFTEGGTTWWTPEKILSDRKKVSSVIFNVIRDVRNVIASWKALFLYNAKKPFLLQTLNAQAYAWRDKARKALDCEQQLDDYYIIKFEDMVMEPSETLRKVGDIIDLPLDITGAMMKSYRNIEADSSWKFKPVPGGLPGFYRSFKATDSLERWKSLTKSERETVHQVASRELIDLGYIQDDSWIEE